jgi:hypothetical protein
MSDSTPDSLRDAVESWRLEADALVADVLDNAMDTEWLAGRISALRQVLDLMDGKYPVTDLRARLRGLGARPGSSPHRSSPRRC